MKWGNNGIKKVNILNKEAQTSQNFLKKVLMALNKYLQNGLH